MIAHGDTFKHAKQYRRHALWRNVACTFQLRLAWDVDDYVLHALSSDTQIQKRYLSSPCYSRTSTRNAALSCCSSRNVACEEVESSTGITSAVGRITPGLVWLGLPQDGTLRSSDKGTGSGYIGGRVM